MVLAYKKLFFAFELRAQVCFKFIFLAIGLYTLFDFDT